MPGLWRRSFSTLTGKGCMCRPCPKVEAQICKSRAVFHPGLDVPAVDNMQVFDVGMTCKRLVYGGATCTHPDSSLLLNVACAKPHVSDHCSFTVPATDSMQVYDSGNGLLAPRIWWSLAYHGHPAPLVLDGGYAKWLEEGRPAELAEPCPIGLSPDMRQWHQGCSSSTDDAPASQPDAGHTTKVFSFPETLAPLMIVTSGHLLQLLFQCTVGSNLADP